MKDIAVYCNSQWEANVAAAIMDCHIQGRPLKFMGIPYSGSYRVGAYTYPYVYEDDMYASNWAMQDVEGKTVMSFDDFIRDYGEVVHDIPDDEFIRIAA